MKRWMRRWLTWEGRYEFKAARRYSHMTPWRSCGVGLFCTRCWWRKITGEQEREKQAQIARMKALAPTLTPRPWPRPSRRG